MRRSLALALASLPLLSPAVGLGEERVTMSCPYVPGQPTHRVVSVDPATREVVVAANDGAGMFVMPASEGPSILAVSSTGSGAPDTAVRLEITEILDDGTLRGTFGPGAVGAVVKGAASLGRPFDGDVAKSFRSNEVPRPAATKAIRSLPDVVRSAKPAAAPDGKVDPISAARAAARRTQSMNNLKQIALAFHNHHDAYGRFPPAAVNGPDGKPWHSWRVLILPFLEEVELYKQYDFSQPWDSPKNLAVAEKAPRVFQDPAVAAKDNSAHYAVLVGDATPFPPDRAATMADANDRSAIGNSGLRLAGITDGTSNTILVATVDPSRKIPWTKPEDIVVGADGPSIGTPDGIGAIHPAGAGKVGLVAIADGSVRAIPTTVDKATLTALATRAGGEIIDPESLEVPGMESGGGGLRTFKIVAGPGGELRFEAD